MKRLIINADDFNLTPGCDRAIEEAVAAGAVTSVSCLVWDRPPDIPEALRGRVGLHLRLSDGGPVLPAAEVPSLVGRDGRFPRSREAVAMRHVEFAEARREWLAQYFCSRFAPTHLDSHRHCHSITGIDTVYEELCYLWGCAGVPLSVDQRDRLRDRGVKCADFTEIRWTDGDERTLHRLLYGDFQIYTTVHLMTHPGYVDADLRNASGMVEVREREFRVLMSASFRGWLVNQQIEPVGYECRTIAL